MRVLKIVSIVGLLVCLPLVGFAGPLVHFEDEGTGDDVTGFGTVHPMLNIQSVPSNAVVIEGKVPYSYGAPNGGSSAANNCLENADGVRVDANGVDATVSKGFGQPANTYGQAYTIEFAKSVSSFSIRVFDFGDWNPKLFLTHSVILKAYDADMNEVAIDGIAYTTLGVSLPNAGTDDLGNAVGDLYHTGDACDANFGEPGYLELAVDNPLGFTSVELTMSGYDPNVGFDSIDFTPCTRTIGYWKNHEWPTTVSVGAGEKITEADGSVKDAAAKEDKGILWNATGKNFSMLCAQLIAAKLNCYGGDCVPDGLIDAADTLLIAEGVFCKDSSSWGFESKSVKRVAAPIASELDAFNNNYECIESEPVPY